MHTEQRAHFLLRKTPLPDINEQLAIDVRFDFQFQCFGWAEAKVMQDISTSEMRNAFGDSVFSIKRFLSLAEGTIQSQLFRSQGQELRLIAAAFGLRDRCADRSLLLL